MLRECVTVDSGNTTLPIFGHDASLTQRLSGPIANPMLLLDVAMPAARRCFACTYTALTREGVQP